tara:strand:- start:1118 stop:1714 length:597 start_codon:yes stop_codon:yes gene_type:complete
MEDVNYNNLEPTYVTAEKVISQELADVLISLVDEKGKKSDWSYNPDCLEYQIANPFSKVRNTTDERVSEFLPELFTLGESFLRSLNVGFQNTICDIVTGYHGFWVLKYLQNGQFEKHCDWDSSYKGISPPIVGTVCIPLNDNYSGGETQIYNNRGVPSMVSRNKLSALVWDGWTQHRIAPITQGERYVLVLHYTGTAK